MCYITINDGVDIAKGENDFTPFRNLFNDFYAKDTSKKVRAIKRVQGMAGKHLTKSPYGYKVDPNDRKKWIVDGEADAVVKRIFDLCITRKGPMQIAKILKAEKALTTKAYYEINRFPKIHTVGIIIVRSAFWSAGTTVGIR